LVVQAVLKRIFAAAPDMKVVGTARSGVEGLQLLSRVDPDVICTDLHMPHMDGLEFTREVMATRPKPILVISTSVQTEDRQNVFRLLEAGAVDVFPKPRHGLLDDSEGLRQELLAKIRVLSGVSVFTLRRHRRTPTPAPAPVPVRPLVTTPAARTRTKLVAIGASTGGPQALQAILSALPKRFPAPIVCVQHISLGFLSGLVAWLDSVCDLPVSIAQPGEYPKPGHIYFPPEERHLEMSDRGLFVCSAAPPHQGHRPSVTVTFESMARFYGRGTLGVLLTGMGKDGAAGMVAISQAGGATIAQSEASCVVFGMPKEAIALGAAQAILPVEAIAHAICRHVGV